MLNHFTGFLFAVSFASFRTLTGLLTFVIRTKSRRWFNRYLNANSKAINKLKSPYLECYIKGRRNGLCETEGWRTKKNCIAQSSRQPVKMSDGPWMLRVLSVLMIDVSHDERAWAVIGTMKRWKKRHYAKIKNENGENHNWISYIKCRVAWNSIIHWVFWMQRWRRP